jgi:hypothetical protein
LFVPTEPNKIQNFIGGQFGEPVGGKYLDNIEPATGKPYSQVADSESRDVELAVATAVRRCRVDREIESFPAAARAANQCCSVTPRAHENGTLGPHTDSSPFTTRESVNYS